VLVPFLFVSQKFLDFNGKTLGFWFLIVGNRVAKNMGNVPGFPCGE